MVYKSTQLVPFTSVKIMKDEQTEKLSQIGDIKEKQQPQTM